MVLPYAGGIPLTETLSWLTDIISGRSGTEQAIKTRVSPRQSFDMTIPIPASDAAKAFNLIYGRLAADWAVPVWHEVQTVGSITAGATSIPAAVATASFRDESLAIIWSSPDSFELVEVQSVGVGELILLNPLQSSFAAAKLAPVRVGRLVPMARRLVDQNHTELQLHFEADDNAEIEADVADQLDGYDLYFECPVDQALTDEITTLTDIVDLDLGPVSAFTPWTHNRKSRQLRSLLRNAAEVWEYRQWLHRRAGRYRPFWMPSFEPDFELVSTGALGATISVRDKGFSDYASARNHIAVELTDGSFLVRTIDSFTTPMEGFADLALNSSLAVNASQVSQICYLGLMRLDTDRVEMTWQSDGIAVSAVMAVEISP